jgi:hypothetical protein
MAMVACSRPSRARDPLEEPPELALVFLEEPTALLVRFGPRVGSVRSG